MDFTALLQGMDCRCGRHHRCDIGFVAVEPDALRHLRSLCEAYQSILLVADENTYGAAGHGAMKYLEGKRVDRVIFSGESVLIPDETAICTLQKALPGHDLILGIGSGVIQDLCKYTAFFGEVPYYIVATAPSMDGYASTGAAMILGGMKMTCSAKVPAAILADTAVLAAAPLEMIQAGYGDIVGKFSSLNDWKLSHVVNSEYFCPEIYGMTMDALNRTLSLASGLVSREEPSIRALMEALVLVGIAMSFAGSSRPASGSEHHLSHFFEITGLLRQEPYLAHGIDVAYSTVVTAKLRQRILERPFPEKRNILSEEVYAARMEQVYGPIAAGCMELQETAGFYRKPLMEVYREKEPRIREILSEMPSPERIEEMLAQVGLSMDSFYGLYGREKLAEAVAFAKDLKERYTVLWLYNDLYGGQGNENAGFDYQKERSPSRPANGNTPPEPCI